VKLIFENGTLNGVEDIKQLAAEGGDVLFPDLTFLRLLVGHTSFKELDQSLPDCHPRNDHGRALAKFLFPKKASSVWTMN